MTISELQKIVDSWIHTYGVRYFDIMTNLAILTEETGEVARIIARGWGEQSFKKSELSDLEDSNEDIQKFATAKLQDELADLIWVAVAIANQTGIDLDTAIRQNLLKKTTRDAARHLENEKINGGNESSL